VHGGFDLKRRQRPLERRREHPAPADLGQWRAFIEIALRGHDLYMNLSAPRHRSQGIRHKVGLV
jgi:hypothetical protein